MAELGTQTNIKSLITQGPYIVGSNSSLNQGEATVWADSMLQMQITAAKTPSRPCSYLSSFRYLTYRWGLSSALRAYQGRGALIANQVNYLPGRQH